MTTDKPLVNRVAKSGLVTINLEDYYPKNQIVEFDLKDYLYMELILKEKDFRQALKEHDWTQYQDKILCVFCSSDAIIPTWAFMLVTSYAAAYATDIAHTNKENYLTLAYQKSLMSINAGRSVLKSGSDSASSMALTSILASATLAACPGRAANTWPWM